MARILVVDDEQDVLELIVKRLRAGGEALDLVALHGLPDAAILDVDLPGMDGIDLLDRLRELRTDLPAMFLTVLWDGTVVARVRATGALYMRKPFTTGSLRTALDLVLVPG